MNRALVNHASVNHASIMPVINASPAVFRSSVSFVAPATRMLAA